MTVFDEDTPVELITAIRPKSLSKEADYQPDQVVGRAEVEEAGGRVVLIPVVKGHSTTTIVRRARDREITAHSAEIALRPTLIESRSHRLCRFPWTSRHAGNNALIRPLELVLALRFSRPRPHCPHQSMLNEICGRKGGVLVKTVKLLRREHQLDRGFACQQLTQAGSDIIPI